jgi:hypothetical protein
MRIPAAIAAALLAALPAAGWGDEQAVATPTAVPTAIPTAIPTATATPTASPTPTPIPAPLPALTPPEVAPEAAARYEEEARAAAAPKGAASDAAVAETSDDAPRGYLPRWGVGLGGGFPGFATVSAMYRPLSWVRLSAGPAWNYFAWGLQGTVSVAPWRSWITPVLSLEGGKFRRGDLGSLVKSGDEDAAKMKPLLARVDYSYAALDLGVELGSQRGLSFSLKVGLSWVDVGTSGTATYTSEGGSTVTMRDPALRGTLGSAKLGLNYWF